VSPETIATAGPVLVTGAAGFVGNAAARRLLAAGRPVHLLTHGDAGAWRLRGLPGSPRIEQADVREAAAVRALVARIRPAVVVHAATHGAYPRQSDARAILETNVLGTLHLFEAAAAAGARLFVNLGSSSEYGFRREPMAETDRLEPNSVYAVAKAAQTHLATLFARERGLAAVTLRLFSVYGPWEEPTRLVPTLIRRVRAGEALDMAAPDTARDFVYVDDVLDVLLDFDRLATLGGEVVNVASGVESRLRDVVAAAERALGRPAAVRWGAMPARRWDSDRWQADVSKTRRLLGWSARHDLASGIGLMAGWMREVGDDYGG
jgi:nucleoside-diphosphate-sugar epimerase